MAAFVKLNGIDSGDLGLRLLHSEPFITPSRSRQREILPGRLGSLASANFETKELGYKLAFGNIGSKPQAVEAFHGIAAWLMNALVMQVWHTPDHFYTGAVEGETRFSMLARRIGQLEVAFICDPPCRQRALGAPGWLPDPALPIPEQISASVKSAEALSVIAPVELNPGPVAGSLPPALHLRITGSWTALSIGSLEITGGSGNTTLFIDCEAQECYKIVNGVRSIVGHRGAFPQLEAGRIAVQGTGLNLPSARLLVIERG